MLPAISGLIPAIFLRVFDIKAHATKRLYSRIIPNLQQGRSPAVFVMLRAGLAYPFLMPQHEIYLPEKISATGNALMIYTGGSYKQVGAELCFFQRAGTTLVKCTYG